MNWSNSVVTMTGESAIKAVGNNQDLYNSISHTTDENDTRADVKSFQAMVVRLIYAVNKLCTKASRPTTTGVRRGCRVIGYLLGTTKEGICLRALQHNMDMFTDAREKARRKGNDGNEPTVMDTVINRN